MNFDDIYATDPDLEKNGVWVNLGHGLEVLVARMGNSRYQSLLDALLKPHQRQIQRNTMDRDVLNDIILQAVSKAVLLDWKGANADGKPLAYSPDVGLAYLRKYKDFREDVLFAAGQMETFRAEQLEDNSKNS